MFRTSVCAAMAAAALFACGAVHAQTRIGNILVPDTSVERQGDRGIRAHTNHLILAAPAQRMNPDGGGSGPGGSMTPSDIRSAYSLPATGGSGIIAIVDAYHHPNAVSDFNNFSGMFNLPQETGTGSVFQVVYQGGRKPRGNTGWAQEEALDIEWSHAMAPGAKVILVECQSSSFTNLLAGVDLAVSLGARQVSMSWGGGEFSTESSYDSHFNPAGKSVTFFASSGDTGGVVDYPACSPSVVGVGGTSLNFSGGVLQNEKGWSGSGGGNSLYESKPSYQGPVANTGSNRSVPDVSAVADPNTGVLVVYNGGLYIFGGTSVACPCWAGIRNLAGSAVSTQTELATIYTNRTNSSDFRDIISGSAGSFSCAAGWDFVTGNGSPLGTAGK